jgi:sugar lactone lactonase YvrE
MLQSALSGHKLRRYAFCLCFILCGLSVIRAGDPIIWETNSRAELLRGEARGVSLADNGALTLAPRFETVFDTRQTFIWSSAADARGNVYLGTGHDGKIFRVGADGAGALFCDLEELDVTALAVGKDGAVYAGTSPDGKVYRLAPDGKAETYFDPTDKYIWSLTVLNDGTIAVGAGDAGKIYRLAKTGQTPEAALLADTAETNIVALAVDAKGQLYAGTDPNGVVLRVGLDGKAFALYDSPLREIHALTFAPDGSLYALALSEAAANAKSETPKDAPAGGPQKSRYDLTGAKSAVLRLDADGVADVFWKSETVVGFALTPAPQGGVLLGTSDKGRIYRLEAGGRDTLLVQSAEGQIAAFATRGADIYAATSNQGKLFRLGATANETGVYESPARDAKLPAAWGRLWWRGAGAELQTRSGNTETPDATWSDWSAALTDPAGANVTSPRARFIQWRATLKGASAQLFEVSLAYLPRNIAPEILSFTAQPTGVALLGTPVALDPNIAASGLDPAIFGAAGTSPPRPLFQKYARALKWQAEDRNGDKLRYTVAYRAVNESVFVTLAEGLSDNFYTLDGAALADGRYIFKVTATDAPANPANLALTSERLSEPLDIDNTAPVLAFANLPLVRNGVAEINVEANDDKGRIVRAEYSLDGGAWQPLAPDDLIADGPRERYTLNIALPAPGEHIIALRVQDANGNSGALRVAVKK